MLLRCSVLFFLLASSYAQDSAILGNLFDGIDANDISLAHLNCSGIRGQLPGCYNCYFCDEPQIKRHQEQQSVIKKIQLVDENCATNEFCCVAQISLSSFRSKDACGMEIPEGYPRAVRKTSRSALQGEYPWRAWIYNNYDQSQPLCAATFFGETINGLIAPASCLVGQSESTIFVVFNTNIHKTVKMDVRKIVIHENFDGSHLNDLALLTVPLLPDQLKWIHPACLPKEPVKFGTVCTAISEDNNFINLVVPQRTTCERYNETILEEEASNPTLMCSVSVYKDFEPQYGSGLFCLEEKTANPLHVVYGLAVYTKHESKTFYTDVAYFSSWIEKQIQKIFIETHPTHMYHNRPSVTHYG